MQTFKSPVIRKSWRRHYFLQLQIVVTNVECNLPGKLSRERLSAQGFYWELVIPKHQPVASLVRSLS